MLAVSRFNRLLVGAIRTFRTATARRAEVRPLKNILRYWGVEDFRVIRALSGSNAQHYLVETSQGRFVLKSGGKTGFYEQYVEFQAFVTNHLCARKFSCGVPVFQKGTDNYFFNHAGITWMLYRYMEGSPVGEIASAAQAQMLGAIVGDFTAVMSGIDVSGFRDSTTLLVEASASQLASASEKMSQTSDFEDIWRFIRELEDFRDISNEAILLNALPLVPIYHDWHGNNILCDGAALTGLIDFDSLVLGPRVCDVANAVIHLGCSGSGLAAGKLNAFFGEYSKFVTLSSEESEIFRYTLKREIRSIVAAVIESSQPYELGKNDFLIRLKALFSSLDTLDIKLPRTT